MSFGVWIWVCLFVCFGVFGVILKKPNFKEVHAKPPAFQDPWQSFAACIFWGIPTSTSPSCPTASISAQASSVPSHFPGRNRKRRGKAEQLPLLSLCLLCFCLIGIQGMQKSIKKKEPNRSLVFVHHLRRAKEASQEQMVAFSPRENSPSDCPPAQPA